MVRLLAAHVLTIALCMIASGCPSLVPSPAESIQEPTLTGHVRFPIEGADGFRPAVRLEGPPLPIQGYVEAILYGGQDLPDGLPDKLHSKSLDSDLEKYRITRKSRPRLMTHVDGKSRTPWDPRQPIWLLLCMHAKESGVPRCRPFFYQWSAEPRGRLVTGQMWGLEPREYNDRRAAAEGAARSR